MGTLSSLTYARLFQHPMVETTKVHKKGVSVFAYHIHCIESYLFAILYKSRNENLNRHQFTTDQTIRSHPSQSLKTTQKIPPCSPSCLLPLPQPESLPPSPLDPSLLDTLPLMMRHPRQEWYCFHKTGAKFMKSTTAQTEAIMLLSSPL